MGAAVNPVLHIIAGTDVLHSLLSKAFSTGDKRREPCYRLGPEYV